MLRALIYGLTILHLGPGIAFALLAFGCDQPEPYLGAVCGKAGLSSFGLLTMGAWLVLVVALAASRLVQRARTSAPPNTTARTLALLAVLAAGALLGAAGEWLSGSQYWFLAIPVALALGWLLLANPLACTAESQAREGTAGPSAIAASARSAQKSGRRQNPSQYIGAMDSDASIRFFETQFQRQVRQTDLSLNPFEQQALPYLRGRVLDYGCGLGNLAVAAARQGCSVVALDASHAAIEHLRQVAHTESLPITAAEADLRTYEVRDEYDTIACIGLLMFFDCPTAFAQLQQLQAHVRPGGVAVVNVLVQGTTYLGMFDPSSHCLFARNEMRARFGGWEILRSEYQDFPTANDTTKSFVTVIARKPAVRTAA